MSKKAKKKEVTKKVTKAISQERERVLYTFDNKSFSISAEFKAHKVRITKAEVLELIARKEDLKRFYSFCNADIKLLRRLEADAQAKKQQLIRNTQYDSRKKLLALIMQIALTTVKQKSKVKKQKAEAKA